MRFGRRHAVVGAIAVVVVCLASLGIAGGQTTPAAKPTAPAAKPAAKPAGTGATAGAVAAGKPIMAGVYFKNVQVLKDIPVDEFMDTMGFFAASLSLNCIDCHVQESGGSWPRYADDTQLKVTARKMMLMVNNINKTNFGGSRFVTCWTCHRGGQQPTVIPSLAEQYSPPPPDDPNEYVVRDSASPMTADQVFAKYIQAVGGAQKAGALTSFVGKGTYAGYDTEHEESPYDVYAKSPGMRTWVVHFRMGEGRHVYDGKNAWVSSPDKPIGLLPLTGGELEGARLDATVLFPSQVKSLSANWKVGATQIDDENVTVLQGSTPAPNRSTVKLFFDAKSGLLVRMVRYQNTIVGTNPIQLDYADYKDVDGVKIPFKWTVSWTDGQDVVTLSDVKGNAPIDAKEFAQPPPAQLQ